MMRSIMTRAALALLWVMTGGVGLAASTSRQAAGAGTQAPVTQPSGANISPGRGTPRAMGVCPPFKLKDEQGNVIDPVKGVNASAPYSPKQTCGSCHDYAKITEGYHFTQGKGEPLPKQYADRYRWVSAPGNYGGNWCSPAPLYRQLAPKANTSARAIDMTSFEFVTATCGTCHPGGGPLEYDRNGNRYDLFMKQQNLTSGGDNGLDGDYYKARWSETGVIEADCLLCHLPEYDFKSRNAQLASLNFKWAATEAAGLGKVKGTVAANQRPEVAYDPTRFDADGNAIVHIAPEPRNETCLTCHAKPNWKKRGASFSHRTDVHIAAGLRCVDCHGAGSHAPDPRIRQREAHQIAKGDCPSGVVRNDLDNTVRSCQNCHIEGWSNAPRASHAWLPPLHMEKLSCQACHIPTRSVKSAQVQASDVFNPAPRISPPGKHIWTFYDQEMDFWNHYGELELFTVKDQPTNVTLPTLARYKGKIYPVNRVHSAFVGFEEAGKPGFNQLFMKDFFMMWKLHRDDPKANSPQLAAITDDSGDGQVEVNRPEEIDALLAATGQYLAKTSFPMQGRRLVYVANSRAYYSSTESKSLDHEAHEATAYASVYKFSHDVAPARAALGAGGCSDCHSAGSSFFRRPILDVAFSAKDGRPEWVENRAILGVSSFAVALGHVREQWIKPLMYGLLGLLGAILAVSALRGVALRHGAFSPLAATVLSWVVLVAIVIGAMVAAATPDLLGYMAVRRFTLDANHFWIACLILVIAVVLALQRPQPAAGQRTPAILAKLLWMLIMLTLISGALMLVMASGLDAVTRLAYTAFDALLVILAAVAVLIMAVRLVRTPAKSA